MAQKPAKPTGKTATAKPRAAAPKAPKRSTTKAAIKKPVAAAKAKALKPAQPPAPPAPRAPNAKVKAKPLAKNVELTKRQLLDRIVTESGMKKGDARTVLDAVLSGLRDAIADGHDIAASPLGKIRLVRKKETPNGELAVLRVKLKDPKKMAANQAANRAENEAPNQSVANGAEPG